MPASRRARPTRGVRKPRGGQAAQEREAPRYMEEEEVTIEIEDMVTTDPVKNIFIHGPSGHGKTLLAGGITKYQPAWFLSTEKEGFVSARQHGSTAQLIRAPDWPHAVAGVKWAETHLGADEWLIIDSGTRMQEMYLEWILATIHRINPQRDLDIPAIADHQKYQNGFKRWYGRIIEMRANTIFITTSMIVPDAEDEPRVVPHLLGKEGAISDYCAAQAGVGIYYAVARESREMDGEITRRALCQPYPPWWAKDRFDALGKTWDVEEGNYFAMADMAAAIDKSLGRRNARTTTGASGRRRRPTRGVAP